MSSPAEQPPERSAPAAAPPASPSQDGPRAPALVVGIVGESGSGKNTVADAVAALLDTDRVTDLRLDDYHRFTRAERIERGLTPVDPLAHDFQLMQEHLQLLRQGHSIRNRQYDHSDGSFGPIRTIPAREIILVTGLIGFPTDELRQLYDLTVFLQPEPDLLFRWKLRRDTRYRGYSEAEALKNIAAQLLDSKEYVLPQAERADVVVSYHLPAWDAPDDVVGTTLRLRASVAGLAREGCLLGELPVEEAWEDEDLVVRLPATIPAERLETWGRERFPDTYSPERLGSYTDEEGTVRYRASLGVVEVLIACLCEQLAAGRSSSP